MFLKVELSTDLKKGHLWVHSKGKALDIEVPLSRIVELVDMLKEGIEDDKQNS